MGRISIHQLKQWKTEGKRVAMITAYDYPSARLVEQAGIPIILVGGEFWQGLLEWMRKSRVGQGLIHEHDLDLMQVIEEPEAIVDAIFHFYEGRGFQPTRTEREKMLNL